MLAITCLLLVTVPALQAETELLCRNTLVATWPSTHCRLLHALAASALQLCTCSGLYVVLYVDFSIAVMRLVISCASGVQTFQTACPECKSQRVQLQRACAL